MKKTFVTFSVFLAVVCCTLAFAYAGEGSVMNVASATPAVKAPAQGDAGYGVSIGTVEAQKYSESGLDLSNFDEAKYVAKISEETYMGFNNYDYNNEIDENSVALVSINSTETAVTIPDSIKVGDKTYSVTQIISDYNSNYFLGFTPNIRTLTIPSTVNFILCWYSYFDRYLDAIYMLGPCPTIVSSDGSLSVPVVYVCDQKCFDDYLISNKFNDSNIFPYGWDYEWTTVNVEKGGEFSDNYLTQNDHNWGAAYYLKVIGNVNDIDLEAIKNLTSLQKLDLSETSITSIPDEFMREYKHLYEVSFPSTLDKIGRGAFYHCYKLKTINNLKGVQTIDKNAFFECYRLNNIDLSETKKIGNDAFFSCSSLESVDLSSALTIGSNSFSNCTSLKNVTLGDSTFTIGRCCFCNTAIESIKLPAGLTVLYSQIFEDCSELKSVELPDGLSEIGAYAFRGCTSLEEIKIPSTVRSIGDEAFDNTGIKNFRCYAAVPPTATSNFMGVDMDMTNVNLYVPPFSKDIYRNTLYWRNFYIMRSIEDQIDHIYIGRPLTINLEEESNAIVANSPIIDLQAEGYRKDYDEIKYDHVGQLTATGEGTLYARQLNISGQLSSRYRNSTQYMPTLINYADKMRADNVTHNLTFYDYDSGKWHFISLPYDVKVSDIISGDNTYWAIRRYDSAARAAGETSSTWVNLTNDDTMEAGKGYIVSAYVGYDDNGDYMYPTLSFTSGNSLTKNNLFRSSDIIVPLTEYAAEFAHNRSWNLIGNPYPCYFDMHYLNEEFTAPVTVWNGRSYVAYSPVDDDLVLSPYEAFFVQCPVDVAEIKFKEKGRLHSNEGNPLYKSPAMANAFISAESRNVFNFEIANDNFSDRARIVLNPEASMAYEVGRDASKFFADNSDCAQIYVAAEVDYSIEERPVNDGIAYIGVRSAKEDVYTLSLSGRYSSEWHVIVTDNLTGISTDLTKDNYQFSITQKGSSKRFSVSFRIGEHCGIDSVISDFGKYANVTVTAVNGVTVYTGSLSEMKVPSSGIYIISNGQETRKAILK